MGRSLAWKAIVTGFLVAVCVATGTTTAYASAPGPADTPSSSAVDSSSVPSAYWLAMKNAYRVRSGVARNQPKGSQSYVYVAPTGMTLRSAHQSATPNTPIICDPNSIPPCFDELSTSNPVPNTYEPGDGNHPNYGPGTGSSDDVYHPYGTDTHLWNWCGPGAADVATWYWPQPSNYLNVSQVHDPDQTSTYVTWNGQDRDMVYRLRGYMTYLAWQMQPTGWTLPGMMDQYGRGSGVRLQEEAVALDWEITGHQSKTGFYIVAWRYDAQKNPTGHTFANFDSNVESDIYYNNVPVVAEVNAQLLPNWINHGSKTLHFITIIGYDNNRNNGDGTYGVYYYTDTCGNSTGCGSLYNAGIRSAPQSTMWSAITSVPYNQGTGDGGWIW